jgi:hypothetical protein
LKAFSPLISKDFLTFCEARERARFKVANRDLSGSPDFTLGMLSCAPKSGWGEPMRALVAIVIAAFAVVMSNDARAQARFGGAGSGEWCLFYDPYTYNCGFATLEQCVTTMRGVGGRCQPNPSGPPLSEAPARRKPKKSRD